MASGSTPSTSPLITNCWNFNGAAASAATLNQVLDQRIDARMARTRTRPLPTGADAMLVAPVEASALRCGPPAR